MESSTQQSPGKQVRHQAPLSRKAKRTCTSLPTVSVSFHSPWPTPKSSRLSLAVPFSQAPPPVLSKVKSIGTLDGVVAFAVASVHRSGVDLHFEAAAGQFLGIEADIGAEAVERAFEL